MNCKRKKLTRGTAGGNKLSLYSNPPGKRLLATAFKMVQGFKSDALPILRYIDPGWIIMMV